MHLTLSGRASMRSSLPILARHDTALWKALIWLPVSEHSMRSPSLLLCVCLHLLPPCEGNTISNSIVKTWGVIRGILFSEGNFPDIPLLSPMSNRGEHEDFLCLQHTKGSCLASHESLHKETRQPFPREAAIFTTEGTILLTIRVSARTYLNGDLAW